MRILIFFILSTLLASCNAQSDQIKTGADQIDLLVSYLEGRNIAIVANHTSLVGGVHLVDTLLFYPGFEIKKVFAPEHGFRGESDAGELVEDQLDIKTGLPIISVYGTNRKPSKVQMDGIDLVVFDIQDIGVRFYTYISTMHYMMEACAQNGIPLVILDRPNPNGNYIDGPIMEDKYRSFVGMHSIPVVHGMTIGELAQMINGEGWLEDSVKCELTIIPCLNYDHLSEYNLLVKPSPNLPNNHSIRLYPSTCFFEGTVLSEGRGTYNPFEVYGHPQLEGSYSFIPRSIEGMSMYPKHKDVRCYGEDLRAYKPEKGWNGIELMWLIDAYEKFPDKSHFFIPYFEKLSGTASLRKQIEAGWSEEEIKNSWAEGLDEFKTKREKYLLYSF
ncbi:MAG: DUF1343 domain-containing protein [Bacteroidales bacterium]|jgi:uncharacterized protein YbbC (DUF1343 family)|nr:DUF1343 domain-containing protein [Bacteroidales bacterium]